MQLYAALVLLPAHAFVLWRAARAARLSLGLPRLMVFALALLAWVLFLAAPFAALGAYRLSTGGPYMAEAAFWFKRILYGYPLTDAFLVYPFWFGLIATFQLGPLLVLLELALFLMPFGRLTRGPSPARLRAWIVLIFLGAGALYVGGRMYFDTNSVATRRLKIALPGLPERLVGLKIVHISDVQADYYTGPAKLARYAAAINALEPDLVVFTGDLITHDPEYVAAGAALLGSLRAPHGVYACMGDHDIWHVPGMVRRSLRENHVILREDENVRLRVRGETIALSVLTTVYRRTPGAARLRQLARASRGAALRIMMAHQPIPAVVDFAAREDYDLFLGGHTHGGQIAFWYPGFELSASMRETEFISGLYRQGPMPVHVNNGLGLTFAPVRFRAPASVALLVLRRG